MEQQPIQNIKRQGVILLVACCILIAAAVSLSHRTAVSLPDLALYIPTTARAAVRIDRNTLFSDMSRFVDQAESVVAMRDRIRTFWYETEQRIGMRMESVLLVITEDRGIRWTSVLFTTGDSIRDGDSKRLADMRIDAIAGLAVAQPLHFVRIEPRIGAFLSPDDTQDYSSPDPDALADLPRAPIAGYVTPELVSESGDTAAFQQIVEALTYADSKGVPLSFGIDIASDRTRIQIKSTDVVTEPSIDLKIPATYDIAVTGSIDELLAQETTNMNPFAATLRSFINDSASWYSFDPDEFTKNFASFDAFLRSGDSWLMAGNDVEAVNTAIAMFIGAESPKRAVSKLPDGSPYREIIRGFPASAVEDWQGVNVTVWSATTTAGTTQDVPIRRKLYATNRDGIWYLTNDATLLSMQFSHAMGMYAAKDARFQSCDTGIVGSISSVGRLPRATLGGVNYALSFTTLYSAEDSQNFIFCAQDIK